MVNYTSFFSRVADNLQGSAIRKMGVMALRDPDLISFAPGYPDPVTFAWDDFKAISADLLGAHDAAALQYGPTRGLPHLIDAIVQMAAARGIKTTAEEILVTTGSQQGLDLLGRILIDPGDVVLVELPAYTGAIAAFRNAGAALVGVRQEDDGIDLDDLDAVVQRERLAGRTVKFLYLVPNFQNPTGLLIGRAKRSRLLEWAEQRNVLIVEDDPYGALYFEDSATPADTRPIKADDTKGRVIYLSSFSKTLAPGFRVAWIVAGEPLIAKLDVTKQTQDLFTGALDQKIVFEAWKRGVLDRQVPKLRAHYQQKRDVMEQGLRAALDDLVTWPEPRGGFFLWAALPRHVNADELLPRAIEHKVIYVAGSAFFVDGTGRNLMRLSFSLPSLERIEEGVRRLAALVKEELARHPEPVGM
ncbi:MAG: PLP-dependent aminotransferase family protein [Bacteroidales bacterium]